MKDSEWIDAVIVFNGYWQKGALTKDAITAWRRKLGDLDQGLVLAAFDLLAEEPDRVVAPTINQVLGAIAKLRGGKPLQRDWSDALAELREMVKRLNYQEGDRVLLPGDPFPEVAINYDPDLLGLPADATWEQMAQRYFYRLDAGLARWVRACGGWAQASNRDYSDTTTVAHFRDIYRAAATSEQEAAQLAKTDWRALPDQTDPVIEVEART